MNMDDIHTIYRRYKEFADSHYAGYSSILGETPAYSGCWEILYENWEYAPPPFFTIEWMAIQPVRKVYRGRLVNPGIIDKSDVLSDMLHTCRIPFEKEDEHTFVIPGYR